MKIIKFGGSSLKNEERIRNTIGIIKGMIEEKEKIMVVVSAFDCSTNALIKMAGMAASGDKDYVEIYEDMKLFHGGLVKGVLGDDVSSVELDYVADTFHQLQEILHGIYLTKELTAKTRDFVCSFGERLSAFLMAAFLSNQGVKAEFLDARKVLVTDDCFGSAKVEFEKTNELIHAYFSKAEEDVVSVVTGFLGSTENKETTTLGRDGSDYTASIFAAALRASEIQIWTDVDGVMTCDPRKVPRAFPIAQMTYEEAMEMSHFGADVIHPPTIQPALEFNIPIRIKNSLNPTFPGTVISGNVSSNDYIVKGITSISDMSLLRFQGSGLMKNNTKFYERLFRALSAQQINIVLICQASSERSICFALSPEAAKLAKKLLEAEFEMEIKMGILDYVLVEDGFSIVAIVGSNMKNTVGVSGKLFGTLGEREVSAVAIAQGSSELNISVVIHRKDEVEALKAIHESFFFSEVAVK